MDINDLRSAVTLLSPAAVRRHRGRGPGRPRPRRAHDEAARLPFDGEARDGASAVESSHE